MLRARFLFVAIACSALVSLAVSAQDGVFDRPDILDVNDSTVYTGSGSSAPFSRAFMYADDSWNSAFGSFSGSLRDANHRVVVWAYLYQPDTTKRNQRRAKFDQKRYMQLWVRLATVPGNSTVDVQSDFIERCKGSLKADDKDNDGIFNVMPAGKDSLRARLRCPRDVLEQLGFSATDIGTIQGIIGKRTNLTINFP